MSDKRFTSREHESTYALDALLREWHETNRDAAEAGREQLLARLREQRDAASERPAHSYNLETFRRFIMHRYTRLVASIAIVAMIVAVLFPPQVSQSHAAGDIVMLPEGGRLDAFDEQGEAIGPCPLKHTDVNVNISGHFSRVTVKQKYHNPYDRKIEAVYTFPLSHRGAVDRMTMTIGDRVIEGEVKERSHARQIYETAREQGYIASLLEQERPNIFTQSVANIEPGAEIDITISYVEILESIDGEYQFAFPMVVAPRYIPGTPTGETLVLPKGLEHRRGIVLRGPVHSLATFPNEGDISAARLQAILSGAIPIKQPKRDYWGGGQPQVAHQFQVEYTPHVCRCAGPCGVVCRDFRALGNELGVLHADGTGHVNGRWFFFDREMLSQGGGFSPDTDQVPDASRITPMPVRPDKRAGHDISVTVTIDTGGPGLLEINSPQHEIVQHVLERGEVDQPRRVSIALAAERDIPNRDFLLTWKETGETINEAIFTHTADEEAYGEYAGGFFTLVLQPPDRVAAEDIRPREIIFVLDNSGSMRSANAQLAKAGISSIEAAKRVINRAIDTMRPNDRFNIISFNNTTDVLWSQPQPNTEENRARAQQYVDQRQGGGGTEMRNAVLKALERPGREQEAERWMSPRVLLDLPADGREVKVAIPMDDLCSGETVDRFRVVVPDNRDLHLRMEPSLLHGFLSKGVMIHARGRWIIEDGRRVMNVTQTAQKSIHNHDDFDGDEPMRIVLFVTDGLVGNDDAIVSAIRENADETRVFTIGMSRSPNRSLLDEMARAGRGVADYVLPDDDVDPIVERFAQRIATPVLTDISLQFSNEPQVFDVLPGLDRLPDLFDVQPLVIHGRYDPANAGTGTLTIRGRTGAGRYERTIDLELPVEQPDHDVIATLWARSMVDERKREGDAQGIIALGETFQIMTEHTSFVAVEKARITVGGEPMLVRVPIEFPKDMSWEGIFGEEGLPPRELRTEAELEHVTEQLRELHSQMRVRTVEGGSTTIARDEEDAAEVNHAHGRTPASEMAQRLAADPSMMQRLVEDSAARRVARPRPRGGLTGQTVIAPPPPPMPVDDAQGGGGGGGRGSLFGSPSADRDANAAKIADLRRSLQGDEEAIKQFDMLATKLDNHLLIMLYEEDAKADDGDGEEATPRRLVVALLPRDFDQATLDSLVARGFIAQSAVKPNTLIVGMISLDKLKALAVLEEVRRIHFVREIIEERKP